MPKTAAVIGAGIAGLVSAKRLIDAGYQVEIFESSSRVGGLIASANLGGHHIDVGAESFAVAKNTVPELCAELGIEQLIVSPQRSDARILTSGGVHLIPHGVLGIPSNLDDPAVVDVVGADAVAAAKILDAQPWAAAPDVTIGALVEARLGRQFVDSFLTPVIAGVHSSDAMSLEAATVAPGLLAKAAEVGSLVQAVGLIRGSAARPGAAVASIAGGMHQLVSVLESHLIKAGAKIHPNRTVESLADLNAFDRVVLAAGIEGAAHLFTDLASIRGVDAAVVALLVESEQLNQIPRGSGVLVAADAEGISAKAATHVNAKWAWVNAELPPNQHILRFSFGRNGVLPADTDSLAALATADAAKIFGVEDIRVVESVTQLWPKALVQPGPGHSVIVKRVRAALAADDRLAIIGAGLGGNGITGILSEGR